MSVVLDERKPLRESILWDLQSSFYDKLNIRCWSDSIVPNFISSNAFLSGVYARNILCFIRDWYLRSPTANRDQPIYIVEIGTGHGKMAYLMLQKLMKMREFFPNARPFKYIMTDFTRHNLEFWDKHPPLQKFFDMGVLDMALFDAENDTELKLERSGEVLNSETLKNPIVAICNYIFDTLRQDAFRIVEGQLQEALCTVFSEKPEPDPTHPDVIRRMRCSWEYRPCTPEYYDDPHLQNMLSSYVHRNRNASILVPIGGINLLKNMSAMAGGKMFLLSGDKAYNHEEELVGIRDPHVAIHGSFSFMVNFHAVRLFVLSKGGFSLHTPYMDGFKCSGFAVGFKEEDTPELRFAWADCMESFGPDNFSTLQRCIKDETLNPSAKLALAVIRMSNYDSDVFFKFKQVLIERAPYMSEKQQTDVRRDILLVYENYYPLQKVKDIAFEVGRLFMGLKQYKEAVGYFQDSQKYCGEHHVSWYNMGICYNYTDELKKSLACFTRSLEIRPDYQDAVHWKVRVTTRIAEASAAASAAAAAAASTSEADLPSSSASAGGGGAAGGAGGADGATEHVGVGGGAAGSGGAVGDASSVAPAHVSVSVGRP